MAESLLTRRQKRILDNLIANRSIKSSEIASALRSEEVTRITWYRDLKTLSELGYITEIGKARATRYLIADKAKYLYPVNTSDYFTKNEDERDFNSNFNKNIFKELQTITVFSKSELILLKSLETKFRTNVKKLPTTIITKELERITIELSWKSSAIEGNTYSLIETESLLKDRIEAENKSPSETIMLINHHNAFKFILENKRWFRLLKPVNIIHIHSMLSDNLEINSGFRKTIVGITGTRFQPLDNEFEISRAIGDMCKMINIKTDIYSQTLLTLLLICYIQPFEDCNKRTSRLMGNSLLLANNSFPLPMRSIRINEYKEAVLLFYEKNNLSAFKEIFIEQCKSSIDNYFRV
jgi:Fic family protein